MATVSSTLKLFDSMTKPIRNITQSMNLMLSAMDKMQNAANRNVRVDQTLVAAKRQLASAEAEIARSINQANQAQERFNQTSKSGAISLISSLKRIATAYLGIQAVQKGMEISDNYISAQARLRLINDKSQTDAQLQDRIFAAADRARGDYGTMASSVGKLGLLAGNAFSGNNEIIKFTELMQKSFKVGGSSVTEQQSGMYQLTQAMAAGKLQGDEFRSIMENAPMLADAIAKFTGKSKGYLKEMSAEGTITADIIKGALFKAADDIEAKFKTLPMTFSDVMTKLKNAALRSFGPVIERINSLINSQGGIAFINNMITGINILAYALNGILSCLIWIGNVVQSNRGTIEPMLYVISAVLIAWALSQIPLVISKINLLIIQIILMRNKVLEMAAAWLVANWPILLIVAAVALLIYAMLNWSDTTVQVIGFVGGLFGILFAFLYNNFAYFANRILSVAEFFANVFVDPVYAVQKLFYDMSINVLQYLTNIARGIENIINKIPGVQVNITSGMGNLLSTLESARDSLKSDKDVVTLMRFKQQDYGDAFNLGKSMGTAAGNYAVGKLKGAADWIGNAFSFPGSKLTDSLGGSTIPNIGKVGEVGKIKDTVDISSEDLKVMRELAEMKNIQNFVSLTPTVQVTTGDVRSESDIKTIVSEIKRVLEDEIASSTSAVYG